MPQVIIKDLHLGGISDTKYSGLDNSAYKIKNLNIHEEPGIIKVQQKTMTDRESGALINDDIVNIIHTARGLNGYPNSHKTFLFQKNGQVFSRSDLAVYTSEFTTSESSCLDALAFNGWMFYTTSTEIGFFAAGDDSVRQNSLSTLQGLEPLASKLFHPLGIVENSLYVGDGDRVHEISVSITEGTGQIASTSGTTVTGTGTNFNPQLKEGYVIRAVNGAGDVEERTIVSDASIDTSATMNSGFSSDISTNTDYWIIKPLLTRDVLIIDSKQTIQVLSPLTTNLIIGTIQEGVSEGSFSGYSRILNWDTRSIDLVSDIQVPEFGINAIMDFFGTPIVQAGVKGALYSYNGVRAERHKRIPGDWGLGKEAIVKSRAVASFLGMPIFGVSNKNGNPVEQGLYTVGGYDAKYPNVFNLEYVSNQNNDAEIGAIEIINTDLIFSSKSGSSIVYRVDVSNKSDVPFIETQVFNAAREKLKNYKVTICYRDIPTGGSIVLSQKTNDASSYSFMTTKVHDNRKTVETSVNAVNAANIQFKIFLNRGTDTNEAPEIESIIIDFNVER